MRTTGHDSMTRTSVVAGDRAARRDRAGRVERGSRCGADRRRRPTTPTSTVEVGAGAVSDGSFKAGEYNGLQDKGAFFDRQLRPARRRRRSTATTRCAGASRAPISASTTRNIAAEVGRQGKFRFTSATTSCGGTAPTRYQTPYLGAGTTIAHVAGDVAGADRRGQQRHQRLTNSTSARGLVPAIGTAPYIDVADDFADDRRVLTPTPRRWRSSTPRQPPTCRSSTTSISFTKRTESTMSASATTSTDRWGVRRELPARAQGRHEADGDRVAQHRRRHLDDHSGSSSTRTTTRSTLSLNFKGAKSFAQAAYYGSFFSNNVAVHVVAELGDGPTGTGTLEHDEQRARTTRSTSSTRRAA